jgi:2-keto-4-pentenoate hydratase/2-oxohepta-3-ene-1,7-dioic acid hydratase in catechol pathway
MKLGRISLQSPAGPVSRIVAVHPDQGRVVDLAKAETLRLMGRGASHEAAWRVASALFPGSMSAAIALGDVFLDSAHAADQSRGVDAAIPIEGVTWLPAVDPPAVRDCLIFSKHIEQSLARVNMPVSPMLFELPAYYKVSPGTLIAHNDEVCWPSYTDYMDYELEFGFVVGRRSRNLTPDEAASHFFGMTIYNDFSARDIQGREMQLGLGPTKSKDFATAIGPWITTADELGGFAKLDLARLSAVARVNGAVWSRGVTTGALWSPCELLAYISQGDEVQPGDIIGSGTVGNGCGLELGKRLSPGDVIELEVSGVGVLRNRIGAKAQGRWWPSRRPSGVLASLARA